MRRRLARDGWGRRMSCWAQWMIVSLLLSLTSVAQAADVSVHASLDRDHAQLGDTVTLTVTVTGSMTASQPDFNALFPDFDVLGTSRSSSMSIDNGHSTSSSSWDVQLKPMRVGTLKIPALHVAGHTTTPQTLVVSAAPAIAQGGPGSPVFVTMTADIHDPYVGQQATLTVRLFYAIALSRGSIDTPQADGLTLQKLGNNARYQAERGGREYEVVEEHYALIPQHPGSIELSPVSFQGSIADNNVFGGFFNTGESVQARSAPLDFKVRSVPASENSGTWLPAREVSLSLTGLPADGRVQIGEPMTLTLTEQATGLPFESLPKLTLPKLSGVEVYPDQPHGKTSDDGNWLHGVRTRAFAVVPQQAGPLIIPEITLHWWNVNTDKANDASIPARTLIVTTAGGGTAQSSASPGSTAPAAATSSAPPPPGKTGKSSQVIVAGPAAGFDGWRALALLALGLWTLTMIGLGSWIWWRRRRRRVRPLRPVPGRRLSAAFMQAVRNGDVGIQADALLAWARSERPQLRNLDQLALALQSPEQRDAIAALQRARYAAGVDGPAADALVAAFAKGFQWTRAAAAQAPLLPPLYPD